MLSDGAVLVTASADAQDDLLDRRDEEMGFSLARATTYQVAALYADGLTRDPALAEIVMDAWRGLADGEMELSDLVYGTALTLAEQDVSQAMSLGVQRVYDAASREAGIAGMAAERTQDGPWPASHDNTQNGKARLP